MSLVSTFRYQVDERFFPGESFFSRVVQMYGKTGNNIKIVSTQLSLKGFPFFGQIIFYFLSFLASLFSSTITLKEKFLMMSQTFLYSYFTMRIERHSNSMQISLMKVECFFVVSCSTVQFAPLGEKEKLKPEAENYNFNLSFIGEFRVSLFYL